MTKRLLIDARQTEETRVVLLSGTRIEDFDYEAENRKQLKGNVYLARVTRVEPSLQAAFVEYGGNRQGFLAFSEIHPDYYRIPIEDREALIQAEQAETDDDTPEAKGDGAPETVGGEGSDEDDIRPKRQVKKYKIQEVISRKQIMLIQVVKEERGNKGAALTTYLSLAGRYCVLMPNNSRGGGVSRKITNVADRKRLKTVVGGLDIPTGMAVIVRTAGAKRTKTEITRDYGYLSKLWDDIRNRTLESQAPCLIHEEGDLIKRSIRDLYTSEVDDVIVEGEEAYKIARSQMKMLVPSHLKKVQKYEGEQPIFQHYGVEAQMDTMQSPEVTLKSGGYLVINQTEALVAIDVNSGKSTRERNIEETALKTNLEAAEELGRQLRLRDLSGLIVVDFIDMDETRNQHAVERRMKDAMRHDRARIQIGSISHFGLLEMSRQRLRISFNESISSLCPHCEGTGRVRSIDTAALQLLRSIEEEAQKGMMDELRITAHRDVVLFILNHKRSTIAEIESRFHLQIALLSDDSLIAPQYRVDRTGWQGKSQPKQSSRPAQRKQRPIGGTNDNSAGNNANNNPGAADIDDADKDDTDVGSVSHPGASDAASDDDQPKRRRRGRRGGRRRRRRSDDDGQNSDGQNSDSPNSEGQNSEGQNSASSPNDGEKPVTQTAANDTVSGDTVSGDTVSGDTGAKPKMSRGRGRGRGNRGATTDTAPAEDAGKTIAEKADETNAEPVKKPATGRRKSAAKIEAASSEATSEATSETKSEAATETVPAKKASHGRKPKADSAEQAVEAKPAAKTTAAKSDPAVKPAKKAAKKKPAASKAAKPAKKASSRAPVSSAPQDVVEVGNAETPKPRSGWWSRS